MHFSSECDPKDSIKADDCKPVAMLSEIFTSTPPQQIERALRISDGNISLAAHQICEVKNFYLVNFTIFYYEKVMF